ncbi:hypothetical protein FHX45_002218 [Amycolatopsis granulosa]|nr:hypothetical protein [Amycolatopsis granulosa]
MRAPLPARIRFASRSAAVGRVSADVVSSTAGDVDPRAWARGAVARPRDPAAACPRPGAPDPRGAARGQPRPPAGAKAFAPHRERAAHLGPTGRALTPEFSRKCLPITLRDHPAEPPGRSVIAFAGSDDRLARRGRHARVHAMRPNGSCHTVPRAIDQRYRTPRVSRDCACE